MKTKCSICKSIIDTRLIGSDGAYYHPKDNSLICYNCFKNLESEL